MSVAGAGAGRGHRIKAIQVPPPTPTTSKLQISSTRLAFKVYFCLSAPFTNYNQDRDICDSKVSLHFNDRDYFHEDFALAVIQNQNQFKSRRKG